MKLTFGQGNKERFHDDVDKVAPQSPGQIISRDSRILMKLFQEKALYQEPKAAMKLKN